MESKRYDKILRSILSVLRSDYAGYTLVKDRLDASYYVQACGMAWKEGKLDDLLFYRMVSQMLATTGDRSLRVAYESEDYAPQDVGFFARRYGDCLYITHVRGEDRVRPGDRIELLNIRPPLFHKAQWQKNFLYSDVPEREIWGNVLKMTDHVTVARPSGEKADIKLNRFAPAAPEAPLFLMRDEKTAYFRPCDFHGSGENQACIAQHATEIDKAKTFIIDLRMTKGDCEDDVLALLPFVISTPQTASLIMGVSELSTLYTATNCRLKAQMLAPYAADEGVAAYIDNLNHMSGKGWVDETVDLWEDITDPIPMRGNRTILLIDTWCEGAPETLVQAAKAQGRAQIIGRPTMGRGDCSNMIAVVMAQGFTLTYPMSVSRRARDGQGLMWQGIAPDVYIPFTQKECTEDVMLSMY